MVLEWTEDYKNSFLDEKKIQKDVDSFMQSFDEAKSKVNTSIDKVFVFKFAWKMAWCLWKKDQEELEKTNQPDEEGWITVTSKHRKANRTLTERNIEKLKSKQKKRTQKMVCLNTWMFCFGKNNFNFNIYFSNWFISTTSKPRTLREIVIFEWMTLFVFSVIYKYICV